MSPRKLLSIAMITTTSFAVHAHAGPINLPNVRVNPPLPHVRVNPTLPPKSSAIGTKWGATNGHDSSTGTDDWTKAGQISKRVTVPPKTGCKGCTDDWKKD